jgi:hypothetical protein
MLMLIEDRTKPLVVVPWHIFENIIDRVPKRREFGDE